MNGINIMNSTLFVPTSNYTSCLILPQRNKSLIHLPSISPFISTVHPKEDLGLVPIRKLFFAKRPTLINMTHSKNISLIGKIAKDFKENERKKKEEQGSIDYKILIRRYKKYKRKCDKKDKLIQIYRKELSQMPNDYNRTFKLNQLIEENENIINKDEMINKGEKNNNIILTKDNENESKRGEGNVNGNGNEALDKVNGEDEDEMKKVIEYINTLDYDQYIKNKEIREALQLLKNKMEQDSISSPITPMMNNEVNAIAPNDNTNHSLLDQSHDKDKEDSTEKQDEEIDKVKLNNGSMEELKPIVDKEAEKKKENIEQYHLIKNISKNVKVSNYDKLISLNYISINRN